MGYTDILSKHGSTDVSQIVILSSVGGQGNVPNDDLWACTEAMWSADVNSLTDAQLTYDLSGSTP